MQYTLCKSLSRFQPCVAFHIETSQLFCWAKQMAGFYIKRNTRLKWVMSNSLWSKRKHSQYLLRWNQLRKLFSTSSSSQLSAVCPNTKMKMTLLKSFTFQALLYDTKTVCLVGLDVKFEANMSSTRLQLNIRW